MSKSFSLSFKMLTRDPVNVMLAIIPTLLGLALYILAIITVLNNSDYFGIWLQRNFPDLEIAGWFGKLITVIFILFIVLLMNWTYILIVGLISAPFNSMLSSRIEYLLAGKPVTEDKSKTLAEIARGLGRTFKNELKKFIFILLMTIAAFVLKAIPLFYPIGLLMIALLVSVQFVDYSWSRHDLHFGNCSADVIKNIVPYGLSGLFFLLLMTIPLVNVLVPAWATSYYTVLWLHRQKRIS